MRESYNDQGNLQRNIKGKKRNEKIAKDNKVMPDPIDDRKLQE